MVKKKTNLWAQNLQRNIESKGLKKIYNKQEVT